MKACRAYFSLVDPIMMLDKDKKYYIAISNTFLQLPANQRYIGAVYIIRLYIIVRYQAHALASLLHVTNSNSGMPAFQQVRLSQTGTSLFARYSLVFGDEPVT